MNRLSFARTNVCWLQRLTLALAVMIPLAPSLPAWAEPPRTTEPSPQEQAVQGLDLMMMGLRRMIEQVPLYGPPELAPNGDIIIRRLTPGGQPVPPPVESPGSAGPGLRM